MIDSTVAQAKSVDAILLVGGRGTRLASVVSDVPKPLAGVSGRPFLDHLLHIVACAPEIRRIVLAAGHLGAAVTRYVEGLGLPIPIQVVVEQQALGTAGAIRNALAATDGDDLLVLNGDSISDWPLGRLIAKHRTEDQPASMIAVGVPDVSRFGQVVIEADRVVRFSEKGARSGPGLINGGVYAFNRNTVASWSEGPLSLERDVLPDLAAQAKLVSLEHSGPFIDIGTPEDYLESQQAVRRVSGL